MVDLVRRIAVLIAAGLLVSCSGVPSSTPSTAATGLTSLSAVTSAAPVASIEDRLAAGMDKLLTRRAQYPQLIRTVEISVGGTTLFEYRRRGLAADETANLWSVTKSVMSALIGIAIGEHLISGVDATLSELLPQYAGVMTPEVRGITLQNVLTMTGGFTDITDEVLLSGDWVRAILTTPQAKRGAAFRYSDASAHLLSAIVSTASGMPTAEYAQRKLLSPLGITTQPITAPSVNGTFDQFMAVYNSIPGVIWPVDPQGYAAGFVWLKLTPGHLMRFGRLYMAGGVWQGAQIVPADWVAESTRSHVDHAGPQLGYGYLWWTFAVRGHPAFVAAGRAGQLVEVIPELNAVLVTSSDDADNPIDVSALLDHVNLDFVPELE